jgi:cytochrome c biogenesis protein CcmG/thiol:disulfide interchange protein DsbE
MTSPARPANRGPMVWYVGLGLIVVLGIVAVIVAGGSGDHDVSTEVATRQTGEVEVGGSTTTEATATTDPGTGTSQQNRPASAAALPTYDPAAPTDPAVGRTIPTVSGTTLDGEPISIGPDGSAKVILFVAHWCPHCQKEVPRIEAHLRDTPMPDDVELLTVSTAVAPERGNYPPSEWLDEEGWTAPVLADSAEGAAARAYGLSSFPYFVVVDAEGQVVVRASGELSVEAFDQLVDAARTGETPT